MEKVRIQIGACTRTTCWIDSRALRAFIKQSQCGWIVVRLTFTPQTPQFVADAVRSAHFPEQQAGIVPVHCKNRKLGKFWTYHWRIASSTSLDARSQILAGTIATGWLQPSTLVLV
ncbi:hypothetical protein N7466_004284 [Penicillium verhagenii]|uniref:uncharacterized protein n=1 Tax=Penicillium verhagenii TaxID=1562060 RepID=UPI002545353F|nr:uncharacterized protein N7466_004284 [Penicillium verhagenii]KAJ5934737.1 hypothetical protein N7466_004284 [Penicillium verhagenii]